MVNSCHNMNLSAEIGALLRLVAILSDYSAISGGRGRVKSPLIGVPQRPPPAAIARHLEWVPDYPDSEANDTRIGQHSSSSQIPC